MWQSLLYPEKIIIKRKPLNKYDWLKKVEKAWQQHTERINVAIISDVKDKIKEKFIIKNIKIPQNLGC